MKSLLLLLAAISTAVSISHAERLPTPDGVFYYQPAASVLGGEALWNNPAGLASYPANGVQIMGDYRNGHWFKSKGVLLYGKRMAFAYRTLSQPFDSTAKEYILGTGAPVGTDLKIGLSYRWISKGPAVFDGQKQWTVGLSKRGNGPYSLGVVMGNLNRQKIDGARTETEMRYSVGYQPLGDKVTLSADAILSTKTRFKNADFVYHGEFTPIAGLYLNGFVDSHRNFELGGRVNLLEGFLGSKSRWNRHGDDLGTTMFAGTTTLQQPSILKEPPRRLIVPLSQFGAENPARPIFGRSAPAFVDLIVTLHRAAHDPAVHEILFVSDGLHLSFAQTQEVRQVVNQLRLAGKTVVFHDESPSNLSYYLASAADLIVVPPVCRVYLVGLRAELSFYAGTMNKLGVKADMMRIGEYKSAVEPYTQTASSEEARAQLNRLMDDLYGQLVDGIADGRKLSADSVRALIDNGPFTSVDALGSGLIDKLAYRTDYVHDFDKKLRTISYAGYVADTLVTGSWKVPPRIAVVVADGEIVGKYAKGSPLGDDPEVSVKSMVSALGQAEKDRRVKGIVLRVDSPGGDALASDVICQAVGRAAKKKPLVVSMGGVAASGGYYVSLPARRMFADPATITGSIGIFGGKVDMSGLYQKIGLGKELYTRGKNAGWLTTSRPFTEDERTKYMSHLTAFYEQFVGLAANHRGLSRDSVDQLGRGRVFSGREAVANGLVDELGGLWESLEFVREQLGSRSYAIEIYPQRRPLFLLSTPKIFQSIVALVTGENSGDDVASALSGIASEAGISARLPYDIDIQ